MHIHLAALSGIVLTYLLVFARTGAMMMLLPALGEGGIPTQIRLVLALAVSVALAPVVQHAYPAQAPATALQLLFMAYAVVAPRFGWLVCCPNS